LFAWRNLGKPRNPYNYWPSGGDLDLLYAEFSARLPVAVSGYSGAAWPGSRCKPVLCEATLHRITKCEFSYLGN